MIVAELRVVPVGTGSSMEETVDRVCEALDDCNIKYDVGAVSTTFEVSTIEELMETVQCCHEAAMETSPRVILNLTIDQRKDAQETMETLREAGKGKSEPGSSSSPGRTERVQENPRAATGERRPQLKNEGNPRSR